MTVGGSVTTGGEDKGAGDKGGDGQSQGQGQSATTREGRPVGGSLSGRLADADKEGVSRATIGAGTIAIHDPAHQGQDVGSINRDVGAAQAVTKDTKSGVSFYASDSSVREIASGFQGIRQGSEQIGRAAREGFKDLPAQVQATVTEVAQQVGLAGRTLQGAIDAMVEALVARGDIPAGEAQAAKKYGLKIALDDDAYAKLKSGGVCGKQGFRLRDLLFTPAHTQGAAMCVPLSAGTAAFVAGSAGAAAAAAGLVLLVPVNGGLDTTQEGSGVDGTEVALTGKSDEAYRTMTVTSPDGAVYKLTFSTTPTGDLALTDGTAQVSGGPVQPLSLADAYVTAQAGTNILGLTILHSSGPTLGGRNSDPSKPEETLESQESNPGPNGPSMDPKTATIVAGTAAASSSDKSNLRSSDYKDISATVANEPLGDTIPATTPQIGKTSVYISTAEDGTTQYVGITDNIEARSAAHSTQKVIAIDPIPGLEGISRADARAVEQVLIEYNGLGKNGDALMNKINSISASNPVYAQALTRGFAILKSASYPGFK